MAAIDSCIEALSAIGFTDLESKVYTFLAQEAPATGYRIAQAIGKPVANTYKAIESLERKGALLIDEGDNRMCRAVPPEELFSRLDRRFRESCQRASEALAQLKAPPQDDRVYQLRSRDQIFERARRMLASAQKVALASLFPDPLAELSEDLVKAAKRVDLVVKAYQPVSLKGVEVVQSTQNIAGDERVWPGQEMHLVIDGQEHLYALLDHEPPGVLQAVWSKSAYLSLIAHNGLAVELAFTTLSRQVQSNRPRAEMKATLEAIRHPLDTPGCRHFMSAYLKAVGQR
jgi:sugar-specific transcriptional regulator TrmB